MDGCDAIASINTVLVWVRKGSSFRLSIRRGMRTLPLKRGEGCSPSAHVCVEAPHGAGGWKAKCWDPGRAQPTSRVSHWVLAVGFNHHPMLTAPVLFNTVFEPSCRAQWTWAFLEPVLRPWTAQKSTGPCGQLSAAWICSAFLLKHLLFAQALIRNNLGLFSTSPFKNWTIPSTPKESEYVCFNSLKEICSKMKH